MVSCSSLLEVDRSLQVADMLWLFDSRVLVEYCCFCFLVVLNSALFSSLVVGLGIQVTFLPGCCAVF
jgi:hypothetical protein